MTRIMPQGLFHILHPGHLYYLEESAKLGEKLYVIIAHDSRGEEKKDSVLNEQARLEFVDALKMVDDARLGTKDDIYDILLSISGGEGILRHYGYSDWGIHIGRRENRLLE